VTQIDTGTEDLLARSEDGVAVLTLNRPERRNALSDDMLQALGRVLAELEVDEDVGCVVLTGAGGAFCAGGDVKAMAEGGGAGGRRSLDAAIHRQRANQRATAGRLWEMATPTIAALPGPAAGAGLSLALACDLRYLADTAFLTTAFAGVALAGDYGGTWFLTRLVGAAKARELYFFSERVPADEARRLGLANDVFPADRLEDEVLARARRLADGPRVALRSMKENLNRAVHADLGECLDLEATLHILSSRTEDHREAATAFVEKRSPRFSGR
jgi:2-(1,2-epoxy-1,2-dihydrophenyl)acetyl-CoA isomerase